MPLYHVDLIKYRKGDYMNQVNLNLNGLKGIVSRLKGEDKQAEKAVEHVVEQAVEQAVKGAKNPEERSLINTEIKLDTVEISIKKGEVKVSVEEPKPEKIEEPVDRGVSAQTPVEEKLASAQFGSITAPKTTETTATTGVTGVEDVEDVDKVKARDGGGITMATLENLISCWADFINENPSYDAKMDRIGRIISAANAKAAEYEEGSEEYQQYKDLANEWRGYRFIMRNSYIQEWYEGVRQQLQQGVPFDDIFNDPESIMHLGVDISRYFRLEDEEDFRTTNPVRDENGYLVGYEYEYDDEGFQYFGGKTVKIDDGPPPVFVYEKNEDPQKRFLYNEAMIASFKVKMLAIQVKLYDNSLSDGIRAKLNTDLNDYRRIMQGLLAEQKNLAVELDLMEQHSTTWGTTTYSWTDPDHGLISGLFPPASTSAPQGYEPPDDYRDMCVEYKQLTDINARKSKLYELIAYAQGRLAGSSHNGQEQVYWQTELTRWQGVLEDLINNPSGNGNTSHAGGTSSALKP